MIQRYLALSVFVLWGIGLIWFYQGCSHSSSSSTPLQFSQYYAVSPSSNEIDNYIPYTDDQLKDSRYIANIDTLITAKASAISNSTNFIRMVKAFAWQESRWAHYVTREGKYYVILGDNGHAYGIMQVNDRYHPPKPNLSENLEYAIALIKEDYDRALNNDCSSGTNKGTAFTKVLRRTYAQYNGGTGDICRNDDEKDDEVESHFNNMPWTNL